MRRRIISKYDLNIAETLCGALVRIEIKQFHENICESCIRIYEYKEHKLKDY